MASPDNLRAHATMSIEIGKAKAARKPKVKRRKGVKLDQADPRSIAAAAARHQGQA